MQKSPVHSQLAIRLPADLRAHLKAYAAANQRSLNGEMVYRLEQSRRLDPQGSAPPAAAA